MRQGVFRKVGIECLVRSPTRRSTPPEPIDAEHVELVRRLGPLIPVPVRTVGERRWEILAREGEWIAAQRAGLHDLPVVVLDDLDDATRDRLASADARVDPISEAIGLRDRLDTLRAGQGRGALAALATEVRRPPSWVCHRLRLLDLDEETRHAIACGALSPGHGRALVRVEDVDRRVRLAVSALEQRWSVRRLEAAVREQLGVDPRLRADTGTVPEPNATPDRAPPPRSPDIERLERRVGGVVGCSVTIDEGAGTLTIDYRRSLDVLEGVLERLGATGEDY